MRMDKIKLMQAGVLIVGLAVIFIIINTVLGTQWMLFYDKSYSGRVIDTETGQPIKGAIVLGMWRLSQFPSEGFGGYAKVSLVVTDEEGNFTIPVWVRFKPWKVYMYLADLAPEIYVYKPGYRFHWTDRLSRAGYPGSYEKTAEERARLKDQRSLTPAKLIRIFTDGEALENYDDWGAMARYPNNYYGSRQLDVIAKALETELHQLSDKNPRKIRLIRNVNDLQKKKDSK